MIKENWQTPMDDLSNYITKLENRVAELGDALYDLAGGLEAETLKDMLDMDEERIEEVAVLLEEITRDKEVDRRLSEKYKQMHKDKPWELKQGEVPR